MNLFHCFDRVHVLDGERVTDEGEAQATQPLWVPGLGAGRGRSRASGENRTHTFLHA